MKFDPFEWTEIRPGQEIPGKEGGFKLVLSAPAAVYVTAEGYEVLLGYGATFDVRISGDYTLRIHPQQDLRAFVDQAPIGAYEPEGEIFTNADRMVMESGSVAEVKQALRMLQIERRAALKEIREARRQETQEQDVDDQDGDDEQEPAQNDQPRERRVDRKGKRLEGDDQQ